MTGRSASVFLLLTMCFSLPRLRGEELPRGQIADPVSCREDAGQSYALYLPTTYHEGRLWPVLYCFDPGGRGAIPVSLFREGAEKYGYILIGSNNSRNGPWEVILRAARAVWLDSQARLAIDSRRVYAAGFSGGARAASGLGKMLPAKLAGVIACGGGLPAWLEPGDIIDVPWFGTAGLEDFNFSEMQDLAGRLAAQGTPRRLEIFSGRHSWPPPELAWEGLAWFDLLAMKSGLRQRDDAQIAESLSRAMAKARDLEARREWGAAYAQYESIVADFSGLADVAPAREKAAGLENSGFVKDFLKNESARESDYADSLSRLKAIYAQLRGPLREPGKGRKIISELHIARLRKRADAGGHGAEEIIARRLLAELSSQAIHDGQAYMEKKDALRAIHAFQIAAEIHPGNPAVLAALASALALKGERKKALKTMAAAIRAGYDDFLELEREPAWDGLRTDPEFIELIAAMKKSPGRG